MHEPAPSRPVVRFVRMLGLASLVSIVLYAYGAYRNQSLLYDYLVWNLFLAWLPLLFAYWLIRLLRNHAWSAAWPVFATFVWLIFLPNSFYLVSDYIHLQEIARDDILFNVVMFSSFVFNGLLVGYTSLLLVHRQLRQRLSGAASGWIVSVVLLLCSYAIFLGRDLRWNSWDFILNPAGLLFDVSDRFIHPGQHPQMFLTTLSFFALLGPLYAVLWQAVRYLRPGHRS